jgi:hypothetical protein
MGPYKAVFAGFKSDLKARKESHLFKDHYSCKKVCDSCGATQAFPSVMKDKTARELLYTNFALDAKWRGTMVSHFDYVMSSGKKSPWMEVKEFHKDMIVYDLMHLGALGVWRQLAVTLEHKFNKARQYSPNMAARFRDHC